MHLKSFSCNPYVQIMRLDKPTGFLLLLWPTLWALWCAGEGEVPFLVTLVFVLGVFCMRAAGCIVNDLIDKGIDCSVERTRMRPLASGNLSVQQALIVLIVLCLTSFVLVLQLNHYALVLACFALPLVAVYPLLKRFFAWPQLGLGIVFNWGILMAYAAVTNTLSMQAWLLYGGALCWTLAYDTIYALVDKTDDLKIGIKSTAIAWGQRTYGIVTLLYLLFYIGLIAVAFSLHFSVIFYCALSIAIGFSCYTLKLMHTNQRVLHWQAFAQCHYEGAIIFSGIWLHYYLISP